MKTRLYVITGLPGVGKTTVAKELERRAAEKGIPLQVINYGDVMLEIARSELGVENRDFMRKLPLDKQISLQQKAARKIRQMVEKASVVVDTHLIIKVGENEYWCGLPVSVLEILKPFKLFLVEASPEEILSRRKADKSSRIRDEEELEKIKEAIQLSRTAAVVVGELTGASFKIVYNREGRAGEAAEEILAEIRADMYG